MRGDDVRIGRCNVTARQQWRGKDPATWGARVASAVGEAVRMTSSLNTDGIDVIGDPPPALPRPPPAVPPPPRPSHATATTTAPAIATAASGDRQGSTIPPGSLSIEYYTYYIVLRINTVSIMGTYLLVLLVLTY